MIKQITIAALAGLFFIGTASAESKPLDIVIVTGERGKETPALETPQSTDVVSREDLDKTIPVDLNQAIQTLPNTGIAPAGESLNFWQQGFTIRGLGSQRVLTLTDGVRLNGQGAGYGGGNISLYDVYSVEKIELLRGPNSVLYGTDAFGGVVNIITRQPTKRTQSGSSGEIATEYNSAWDMERTGGYIDLGNEFVSAVFGGSQSENANPKLADGTVADSGRGEKTSGFGRVRLNFSRNKTLDFFANFSKDENVLAADTEINFGPLGTAPILIQFPSYTRMLAGLDYKSKNLGVFLKEYRVTANWQGIRRQFDRTSPEVTVQMINGSDDEAPRPVPGLNSVRVLTDDEIDTFELSNQMRFEFLNNELVLGADLGRDTAWAPETETKLSLNPAEKVTDGLPTVTRNRVDAEQIRLGAYARNRTKLNSQWDFVLSGRLDWFDVKDTISTVESSQTGYSGSASVIHYITENTSAWATIGSGFRIPDLSERYQRAVFTVVEPIEIIGNPELESERSRTVDLGYKWRYQRLRGEAAVFYNRVENYITTQVVQARPRVEQTVNTDTVELWGWELSGEADFDKFTLFANASRTLAPRSTDWVRTRGATFNYGIRTRVAGFDFAVRGRTTLDSKDLTILDRTTSTTQSENWRGFTVLDLELHREWSLTDTDLFATVSVNNLFNRVYREPFFDRTQTERSVSARIGVKF